MTQISQPWGGTTTGDAGSYSFGDWAKMYADMFAQRSANKGVFDKILNELAVTVSVVAAPDTVQVATGVALVDGTWYENDAAYTEVMPTGAAGTYTAVLAKDWTAQTVRVDIRIGAASAVTQTDGVLWEIPLAEFTLDTNGTVSGLTDKREWIFNLNEYHSFQLEPFSFVNSIDCATGDGKASFIVPKWMDGWKISPTILPHSKADTAGATGTMDIQIRNVTQAVDILSTKLTTDSGEVGSDTAAAPAVVDEDNNVLAAFDEITLDYDAVQSTPAVGNIVTITAER